MLIRIDELQRVGDVYVNPRNLLTKPLSLKTWRDFMNLDERTYGTYARTIYNPRERFLVTDESSEARAIELSALYCSLLTDPEYFCGGENLHYQLEIGEFEGLPFANGWTGSRVALVGEAPGRRGCGKTGVCFYRDASGSLLRKVLFHLGINPDFVYITNVVKCNPPNNRLSRVPEGTYELLARELEILEPEAVFALGRTAERALQELGFEVEYLRHPAWYVRRGVREPNDEMVAEYAKIREAFGEWTP
ncbi:uracil-DNA glycosylase family protein [Thermococcus sp. 21S9]|uniref:uracil-DNA glycosylase family protein n=1 Tax=Thermococcus sp. 21S9 TaxID=1638223 RepID=UPI00143A0ED7|nr:uracil-DNA glycosylase family protein [Thermococcus sp. 21S9]NJE55521.1 uracil-DNA glycosylase [Thermococcus sp. 21S9]